MKADVNQTIENLRGRGFAVSYFKTAAEAADYLDEQIRGTSVGIGGSETIRELGVYPRLREHNVVNWHADKEGGGSLEGAAASKVYLTSANALSQTGEVLNIDGRGNRVAASVYGRERVYIVCGVNKLEPDFQSALDRARNIAGPKNTRRLGKDTPCARGADIMCYDCRSPERICNILMVLWGKPSGVGYMEIVLIGQDLGY